MANTHRTPEQWHQIFKQHASSGLQTAQFCKQQKLNPSSFYAWRKRLENTSLYPSTTQSQHEHEHDNSKTDWVNIMPEQTVPSPSWDIELALPNGIVLRMMNN
ncbi:MAG: transposase [Colwellia sp.]|nr:transposase [Colwellia sp.]